MRAESIDEMDNSETLEREGLRRLEKLSRAVESEREAMTLLREIEKLFNLSHLSALPLERVAAQVQFTIKNEDVQTLFEVAERVSALLTERGIT